MERPVRLPSRKFYVYMAFDWSGVPRYVGKGKGNRYLEHRKHSSNRVLRGFIEKYGELPCFKIKVGLSEQEAFDLERVLITTIGRKDLGLGPLFNHSDGGDGVANPSGYTKELISQKAILRQADPAIKAVKSAQMKAQRADPNCGLNKGHHTPHTELTKKLIREKAIGRMKDLRHREAIAATLRGRKQSPEVVSKRIASVKAWWDKQRSLGHSPRFKARDEAARRAKIKATMRARAEAGKHWLQQDPIRAAETCARMREIKNIEKGG